MLEPSPRGYSDAQAGSPKRGAPALHLHRAFSDDATLLTRQAFNRNAAVSKALSNVPTCDRATRDLWS